MYSAGTVAGWVGEIFSSSKFLVHADRKVVMPNSTAHLVCLLSDFICNNFKLVDVDKIFQMIFTFRT